MKAIALYQPWATLLATGEKQYETRSWQTNFRGPILIHASRKFMEGVRTMTCMEPFRSLLEKHGIKAPTDLKRGAIIGICTVEDCLSIEELESKQELSSQEKALGDYRPGRWAWKVSNPRLLPEALEIRGSLGVFEVNDSIISTANDATQKAIKEYTQG